LFRCFRIFTLYPQIYLGSSFPNFFQGSQTSILIFASFPRLRNWFIVSDYFQSPFGLDFFILKLFPRLYELVCSHQNFPKSLGHCFLFLNFLRISQASRFVFLNFFQVSQILFLIFKSYFEFLRFRSLSLGLASMILL
jgi:hypothetical protein